MLKVNKRNLPEEHETSQWHLDSNAYSEQKLQRLAQLRFYHYYYTGEIYKKRADWSRGNGYSASVQPPSMYINYARFIIDRMASFSFDRVIGVKFGEEFVPRDGLAKDADASEGAIFLSKFITQNNFLTQLTALARDALIFGDVGLKLHFTEEEPFPLRHSFIPAEAFDYEHSIDNVQQVIFVREEYAYEQTPQILRFHREDTFSDKVIIYKDEIRPLRKLGSIFGLYPLSSPLPKFYSVENVIPNPFGFIPVVQVSNRLRLGNRFGTSELKDITTILDDINWKVSQRSRNISRTMNAIIKNINGRLIHDRLDDTQLISVIGENAQLDYLVNRSDLTPVKDHISELKQALTDLTGVVMLSPDKLTSIGALSGFALSILYEPLLNTARAKRREIGSKVERFLSMVLKAGKALGLLKLSDEDLHSPKLIYGPDLHFTEEEKMTRLKRIILAKEAGLNLSESEAIQDN